MNCIVDKKSGSATIFLNIRDPRDRETFISWLKQIRTENPADQFQVDECIAAAGGEIEHQFPGYEMLQQ